MSIETLHAPKQEILTDRPIPELLLRSVGTEALVAVAVHEAYLFIAKDENNDNNSEKDPPPKKYVVPRKGGVGGGKPSKNGSKPSKEEKNN